MFICFTELKGFLSRYYSFEMTERVSVMTEKVSVMIEKQGLKIGF